MWGLRAAAPRRRLEQLRLRTSNSTRAAAQSPAALTLRGISLGTTGAIAGRGLMPSACTKMYAKPTELERSRLLDLPWRIARALVLQELFPEPRADVALPQRHHERVGGDAFPDVGDSLVALLVDHEIAQLEHVVAGEQ